MSLCTEAARSLGGNGATASQDHGTTHGCTAAQSTMYHGTTRDR